MLVTTAGKFKKFLPQILVKIKSYSLILRGPLPFRGDSLTMGGGGLYPFDRGDRKINETHFARFFRPPPPVVNEPPLKREGNY